jgi:hypothetical protein
LIIFYFSLKKLKFSGPKVRACHNLNYPAQTKKKEKIGTIFCPKGGLGQVPKGPLAQSAVIY